jgi:hypothetical protein
MENEFSEDYFSLKSYKDFENKVEYHLKNYKNVMNNSIINIVQPWSSKKFNSYIGKISRYEIQNDDIIIFLECFVSNDFRYGNIYSFINKKIC